MMTNQELINAIQATKYLVYSIASSSPIYQVTVDHYKALLKEQQRRTEEKRAVTQHTQEYYLVGGAGQQDLQDQVNECLQSGWVCQGGVVMGGGYEMFQALVRSVPPTAVTLDSE